MFSPSKKYPGLQICVILTFRCEHFCKCSYVINIVATCWTPDVHQFISGTDVGSVCSWTKKKNMNEWNERFDLYYIKKLRNLFLNNWNYEIQTNVSTKNSVSSLSSRTTVPPNIGLNGSEWVLNKLNDHKASTRHRISRISHINL